MELSVADGDRPGELVSETERGRWRGIMQDLRLSGVWLGLAFSGLDGIANHPNEQTTAAPCAALS